MCVQCIYLDVTSQFWVMQDESLSRQARQAVEKLKPVFLGASDQNGKYLDAAAAVLVVDHVGQECLQEDKVGTLKPVVVSTTTLRDPVLLLRN